MAKTDCNQLTLIFGILSLALIFMPPLGLIFSILSIVFYKKIKKEVETKATAGLALGLASLIINIFFVLILIIQIIFLIISMTRVY